MPVKRIQVRPEITYRGAQHAALAGHRLEQQVGAMAGDLIEQRQQALPDLPERRRPVTADGRPGVHDDTAGADLPAPEQRVPERSDGQIPGSRVRRAEIDQVRGMNEHADPGPVGLVAKRRVLPRVRR